MDEKTITGEELIKLLDEQRPKARKELHDFIDSMVKDGKYHCMVIGELIGEYADMLHVGYDAGYLNGKVDYIQELRKRLTEDEVDLIGIEEPEEETDK